MRSILTLVFVLVIVVPNSIQTAGAEKLTNSEIRDAIDSGRLQSLGTVIRIIEQKCVRALGSKIIAVEIDSVDWVYRITLLTRSSHILQIEVDGASGRIERFHQLRRGELGESGAHSCG